MLCLYLVYVCLNFQWETIDLTSSRILLDSATDSYSSISDSIVDLEDKNKSEGDLNIHPWEMIDLASSLVKRSQSSEVF